MTTMSPAQPAFDKGMAFLALRDHLPEAEAAFREGLTADPNHGACHLYLGVTLRNLSRLREADAALARALALNPRDPVVHMQIGTLRRWQGRMSEALEAYDGALNLDPLHVETRVAKAITLQGMRRWHEALEIYETLIEELPAALCEASALHLRRTTVLEVLQRIQDAGLDPTRPPQELAAALYQRANQLVLEDALDEAVRLYEEAALLQPDYSDPSFPIGVTVDLQMARRPTGAYRSCRWLEQSLHFQQHRLAFCCVSHTRGTDSAGVGPFHGGPVPMDYVLARRIQMIRQNQAGVDNPCRCCPELESKEWAVPERPFTMLVIGNHTSCNQRCSYCALAQANFEMPAYSYKVEPCLDSLLAGGWIPPDVYVVWGGGEPTVSREFPSVMAKLAATPCRFNILTNTVRLQPILLDLLGQGRCDIVTSVDSGTPASFYRVKYMSDTPVLIDGVPAFDVVWSHIGAYAHANTTAVIVKYVCTRQTIQESDLRGFVALCLQHGVTQVMLSPEIEDVLDGTVTDDIWDGIRRAKELAMKEGLLVWFSPLFLKARNMPPDLLGALRITDRSSHSLAVR